MIIINSLLPTKAFGDRRLLGSDCALPTRFSPETTLGPASPRDRALLRRGSCSKSSLTIIR